MKKDTLSVLCCPDCHGKLEITVAKENPEEVLEGTLKCVKCGGQYSIKDGIPDMVLPETR